MEMLDIIGRRYKTPPANLIEEINPFKRWAINFWSAHWGIQLENSRELRARRKLRDG